MTVDASTKSDSERLVTMETRMDTFVTKEKYEREYADIKVLLAEIRSDIRNLKWQIAVIVSILSSIISFLVSRIPI